ncbi:alpha-L-rhamnosidase N-terminal domain-containing protein [Pedobacter sp. SYP-B3415]|uniref:alpha-L-rhamnosidase-related protein n=1 Tax=Pedobacter sp. SYP-B3415 TaxID=2496641 RepID=UPI00101DBC77|nr:alpha-L-rhamnosidase N-terminal domain-containing protein [Pedobacter sp. SYP-B3415]
MKSLFIAAYRATLCLLLLNMFSYAQETRIPTPDALAAPNALNAKLRKGDWSARWITCPDISGRAYGVYHFRRQFDLATKPKDFTVHVTADNRYRLFVNGQPVGRGPARGDLYNWNFETYDLAPYLRPGTNVVAAVVWNMGEHAPVAQISNQTAFLLQGNDAESTKINSDSKWKVTQNNSYQPCGADMGSILRSYVVVGPGDDVDASRYPWGWEQSGFDDLRWSSAKIMSAPVAFFGYGTDNLWTLTPRNIPMMEESVQRMKTVRRSAGLSSSDHNFLKGSSTYIPASKKVSILIDQGFETTAYPVMKTSGGKESTIKLTYAEALFDSRGEKGNRNDIAGKKLIGLFDVFKPDGGKDRVFSPLWFRTYRYVQLDIETGSSPLVLEDLHGLYTGYPFRQQAAFTSSDTSLTAIWETGWRTARLCAGETYFDCPYYEQLQYEGDTRIQALISLYNAGDDRLMRKAINDFYNSRVPEGLTQGRYPSSRLQVIPPFSLFWVSMLYDYWMHRQDDRFLNTYLDGAARVLDWYAAHVDADKNMLGPMKWWNFTDWNHAFSNGVPDGATDGNSAVITLQYAYTLQQAAELFAGFGRQADAARFSRLAVQLARGTYNHCFDQKRMVMANTPEKKSFSQHAGIMAILSNAIPAKERETVLKAILEDPGLSQATFYYRFYLSRAMILSGRGNDYYAQLAPWRGMLANGLTTFAENPDPTRSDCHAWSASPNYDFLATLCGIMPAGPGFKEVRIEPFPGPLTELRGSMPHPAGTLRVELKRKGAKGLDAVVELPAGISGSFVWNGRSIRLAPGRQELHF